MLNFITPFSLQNKVNAKVELYEGSTLVETCTCSGEDGQLQDFTITREGDSNKFFGFGVCHKLSLNLIDLYRRLNVTTALTVKVCFGTGGVWVCPYPTFYISEVNRDEKSNSISVTAYDALKRANEYHIKDLNLTTPYTLMSVATKCASLLGLSTVELRGVGDIIYTAYPKGANFSESDTNNVDVRSLLNYIAEVAHCTYFISNENTLVLKVLNIGGEHDLIIDKDNYFELNTKTNRRLTNVCHTTELGDSVTASTGDTGTTQYLRDNPFLENREDIDTLLNTIIGSVGGLTINQFYCDWTGDYLLEIGDKIGLVAEDDSVVTSYLLSDTIKFDGTLTEVTEWEYTDNDNETPSNPTTLGDKLNQTFARVDKVNNRIELLASEVTENGEKIANLTITSDEIALTVKEHEEKIEAFQELETGQIVDRMAQIELELDGISATVSEVETNVSELSTSVGENSTAIDGLETNATVLNEKITTNATKIGSIEVSLSSVTTLVADHTSKITQLETDTGDLEKTVEENTSKIGELEVTTSSINATVSSQSSKITTLETNTTNLSGEVETLGTVTEAHTEQIGALQVRDTEITATVTSISESTTASIGSINTEMETLTKEVATKVTASDVSITVKNELANGVSSVETTTGFTFNETGLTIEKSGKEMKTQITEDGMTVYRDTTAVLTADNTGVDAKNLKASTYLIVGTNSRFENYGTTRTACFWIGD